MQQLITSKQIKKEKVKRIIKRLLGVMLIALFPIVLFMTTEFLNGMGYNFSEKIVNLLTIIALFFGIYAITGKLKISMIITAIIAVGLATVNYLLVTIRGTAITPTDFYSITMVSKMANEIKITLPYQMFISAGIVILWIILCLKIMPKEIKKKQTRIYRITSMTLCIVFFLVFFFTDLLKIEITYNTKEFYQKNGVYSSFLTLVKEMSLKKPEGYSTDVIKENISEEESKKKFDEKNKPNVIVIMNESLADLASLYNLNISEDNMPFIHSLKENTIKAKLHSSSLGGKTANCEWEFLTSNTTRFLPVGAVPYQLYVKEHTISLVDTMNEKGYYTSALHPYNPEGYNRNLVYPLMGFDNYKFVNEMENLNMLRFGEYADDLSTYKNIIKQFEEKEKGQKIFNFTVTMQNHLSYWDRDFKNNIILKDYDKEEYFQLNQYLSLVKLSDDAFKYIVDYFKDYDEPTVIMMFGDHQPNLVDEHPEIFGKTGDKKQEGNKYIVPMVLWANYDIKEKDLGDTSMNYLSNILFDAASLNKTKYMKYLEKLRKKYPVITANIYKDADGNFHEYETTPEDFKLYEYIQYNNMFDDEKIDYLYK